LISAGLDVGSRTIALVLYDGRVVGSAVVDTGIRPLERCRGLLAGKSYQRLVVTGYGRHLVAPALGGGLVSEIGAYARGAGHLYPDCGTVIDIGGQDSKAISLDESGRVRRFEMNDRCAAGTGRFLEVMAATLELEIGELGGFALTASGSVTINSLCTVFAESEVVSLIARGEEASAIAQALHQAVATRVAGMVRRVGLKDRVVFAGGAARNGCLKHLLGDILGVEMTVPREPQLIGALGAALLAGNP
jgi:predicted CoA-substrate-specific enzyme activase